VDNIAVIEISGRSKCGRAYSEDEVLVEILKELSDDAVGDSYELFESLLNFSSLSYSKSSCLRLAASWSSQFESIEPLYSSDESNDDSDSYFEESRRYYCQKENEHDHDQQFVDHLLLQDGLKLSDRCIEAFYPIYECIHSVLLSSEFLPEPRLQSKPVHILIAQIFR
jgi:hypothetical protein